MRCAAVYTEQIFVKTRRPTAGILAYGKGAGRRIGGKMPVKTDLGLAFRCYYSSPSFRALLMFIFDISLPRTAMPISSMRAIIAYIL